MAELVAFREDRLGFRFKLGVKAMLGRASDCDLILFDRSASRRHAEITQSEDDYFIEDLNSTNGTLVNDLPITEKIKLKPYDCLKIGQEVYIFEPFLDVITGQAPSALIVKAVNESQQHIVSRSVQEAASSITQAQASCLASFVHSLCLAGINSVYKILIDFLESQLGATAIAVLWPGGTGPLHQLSLLSHPQDKRLLLSDVPFRRVAELGQAMLWPHIITELFFNAGNRNIEHVYQPCLLSPLFSGDEGHMGLLYVENANRTLEETDLNLLTAAGLVISPYIKNITLTSSLEDNRRIDDNPEPVSNLIGRDHQIKVIFSTASHLAQGDSPIFITGEVGTGKTSLARHIHQQSQKKNGRFIDVTLSGLSQSQMELILFGQDGEDNTVGLFLLADNGTIFLRHIENIPLSTQKSILMCLEEGLIYPVDSRQLRMVSTRIITSSAVNIQEMVENGTFREDLYTRLTAINLALPPLRETRNDIEQLAYHYSSKAARFLGLPFHGLDHSVVECLRAYPWPGNITELKNECLSMAHFSRNGHVVMDCLPVHLRLAPDVFNHGNHVTGDTLLGEAERIFILKALATHMGDIEITSQVLGLSPEDVIKKARNYGLDPMDFQSEIPPAQPKGPAQTTLPNEEE